MSGPVIKRSGPNRVRDRSQQGQGQVPTGSRLGHNRARVRSQQGRVTTGSGTGHNKVGDRSQQGRGSATLVFLNYGCMACCCSSACAESYEDVRPSQASYNVPETVKNFLVQFQRHVNQRVSTELLWIYGWTLTVHFS